MNVIKKLFYIQDYPGSDLQREWRWFPALDWSWKNGYVSLGVDLQMTKWKGEHQKPRTVGSICVYFYWNPLKWRINFWHSYYDGPNCHWHIGPFAIGRFGAGVGWCNTCDPSGDK